MSLNRIIFDTTFGTPYSEKINVGFPVLNSSNIKCSLYILHHELIPWSEISLIETLAMPYMFHTLQ